MIFKEICVMANYDAPVDHDVVRNVPGHEREIVLISGQVKFGVLRYLF